MEKNEKHQFLTYQNQIIDNLETLITNLENCEEFGMEDIDDTIYNTISELVDETNSADTILELSEIISRAKVIENNIDSWYSKEGITNIELSWPQLR